MPGIEALISNEMEQEKFQRVISDDFAFADSLIDNNDINRVIELEKEDNE